MFASGAEERGLLGDCCKVSDSEALVAMISIAGCDERDCSIGDRANEYMPYICLLTHKVEARTK